MATHTINLSGVGFNQSSSGAPPWDIGRPQPVFVQLSTAGEIRGRVLDIGCGTGENALYLAALGHDVCGIDFAYAAIEQARKKSLQRGIWVNFRLVNALDLPCLGQTFDTVIDCGLFHVLSDEGRLRLAQGLTTVLDPGGRYFMLCFCEQETREGPRRITQHEIRSTFRNGWTIESIREAKFETTMHEGGAWAWLASITRTDGSFI
jgi:cyclopropane fatty-acyl-phospholipid synthase-like methyltransferase